VLRATWAVALSNTSNRGFGVNIGDQIEQVLIQPVLPPKLRSLQSHTKLDPSVGLSIGKYKAIGYNRNWKEMWSLGCEGSLRGKLVDQEVSEMELSAKNEGKNNLLSTEKNADVFLDGTEQPLPHDEIGKRVTWSRFNPDVRIAEGMMWHPPRKPTARKSHDYNHSSGPTWGYLFGQIVLGFAEILIPLGFIVGMIYWRAPWLFWAAIHFLRGEPILHF